MSLGRKLIGMIITIASISGLIISPVALSPKSSVDIIEPETRIIQTAENFTDIGDEYRATVSAVELLDDLHLSIRSDEVYDLRVRIVDPEGEEIINIWQNLPFDEIVDASVPEEGSYIFILPKEVSWNTINISDLEIEISTSSEGERSETKEGDYTLMIVIILISILGVAIGVFFFFSLSSEERRRQKLENEKRKQDMMTREAQEAQRRQQHQMEMENRKRMQDIQMARNFEKAERFSDAAKLYEKCGLWEDAGRVRRKERDQKRKDREVVTRQIHVQANELFSQIQKNGLAISYTCPNCKGTLEITGTKRHEICPYCHSNVDMNTLSDLVRSML